MAQARGENRDCFTFYYACEALYNVACHEGGQGSIPGQCSAVLFASPWEAHVIRERKYRYGSEVSTW